MFLFLELRRENILDSQIDNFELNMIFNLSNLNHTYLKSCDPFHGSLLHKPVMIPGLKKVADVFLSIFKGLKDHRIFE